MKAIRVQYSVRPEFAAQNRKNIAAVMAEMRSLGDSGCRYTSYAFPDGKTFMHLVHYRAPAAEDLPGRLPSFKQFQKELKENLEVPPKAETIEVAGSSFELF